MNRAAAIAAAFELEGEILDARPHGRGLIHDTWVVTTSAPHAPRAILQRINRRAFDRPEFIMENLRTLLEHVGRRAAPTPEAGGLRFPILYRARDGGLLVMDDEGDSWRAMSYIEGTRTYARPRHAGDAHEAGHALGRFHRVVADLDGAMLHDTRPDFHHTPRHLERLDAVLARAEPVRLADEGVAAALEFIAARRAGAGAIETGLAAGTITRQIVHGDPKLDNVLFDEQTDRAVALIDLDTVKPGTIHHDIADCLRSCCNRAGESPGAGEQARYDLDMCRAGLTGYFEAAGATVRGLRAEDLYEAIRLIPFELGVRFLADHLDGDRYFRITFAGQNLVRAAAQLRLSVDVEANRATIEDMAGALLHRNA